MLITALPFLAQLAPLLNAAPPFLPLYANMLNAVLLFFIWEDKCLLFRPPCLILPALWVFALPPWFN
jgi:hypothetical protein